MDKKHGKISFQHYLDLNISSQNHLDGGELNKLFFEFLNELELMPVISNILEVFCSK